MNSKVLVALKPGYTNPSSVKRAKLLAQQSQFDLLLFSAVHEDQVSRSKYGTKEVLQNIEQSMLNAERERLQEIKSHFDGLCASVAVEVQWQTPVAEAILSAAEAFGADLIVLAGSVSGRLGRMFAEHTDWEVIRRARVPVLVSQDPEPKAYASILAAVDPTHLYDEGAQLDNKLLTISDRLRDLSNAELFLGHVYPARESMSIDIYMPPIDEYDDWQALRDTAVLKMAEAHHIDEDHIRLIAGSPAHGIADLAKALESDVVVMGAVSKTFSSDRTLGAMAEKVLHGVDCDLLFVPLDWGGDWTGDSAADSVWLPSK